MKVINYLICSTILFVGIVLLMSGSLPLVLADLLWVGLNSLLTKKKAVRKMWRSFYRTSLKLNEAFGLH